MPVIATVSIPCAECGRPRRVKTYSPSHAAESARRRCDRCRLRRRKEQPRTTGHGTGFASRPLPPTPTSHRPGSPEKMDVMHARLAAGFHLHHPLDA